MFEYEIWKNKNPARRGNSYYFRTRGRIRGKLGSSFFQIIFFVCDSSLSMEGSGAAAAAPSQTADDASVEFRPTGNVATPDLLCYHIDWQKTRSHLHCFHSLLPLHTQFRAASKETRLHPTAGGPKPKSQEFIWFHGETAFISVNCLLACHIVLLQNRPSTRVWACVGGGSSSSSDRRLPRDTSRVSQLNFVQ